jgi:Zn finger protein HypA/HybF involved in hydrogenase expression
MPVAPKPFKYKCLKCGYSKIIKPKSDVINPAEWNNVCPKCQTQMNRKELNVIEKIFWR